MKGTSILSLVQASNSLHSNSFESYLNFYGIDIKKSEVDDLIILVDDLYSVKKTINVFERYYIGYKIPQIGKEFDLLRIGGNYIVNIELKSISSEEKILKQLIRNKYYLSCLGRELYNICYVSSSKIFYILNVDETLRTSSSDEVINILQEQNLEKIDNIDILFNPSDYLVSPFNSTQKFLKDQYFLTQQQEDVKSQVLTSLYTSKSANFISIVGSAGTGKTLLVYDMAKELIHKGMKPLIIHCGYLNDGQEALKLLNNCA